MKIKSVENLSDTLRIANGPMTVLDHNIPEFLQVEGAEAKKLMTDEGILLSSIIWEDDLYGVQLKLALHNWELHSTQSGGSVRSKSGQTHKLLNVNFVPYSDVEDDCEDCDCDICEAAEAIENTSIDFTLN